MPQKQHFLAGFPYLHAGGMGTLLGVGLGGCGRHFDGIAVGHVIVLAWHGIKLVQTEGTYIEVDMVVDEREGEGAWKVESASG